jgi:hypothetical protein
MLLVALAVVLDFVAQTAGASPGSKSNESAGLILLSLVATPSNEARFFPSSIRSLRASLWSVRTVCVTIAKGRTSGLPTRRD